MQWVMTKLSKKEMDTLRDELKYLNHKIDNGMSNSQDHKEYLLLVKKLYFNR